MTFTIELTASQTLLEALTGLKDALNASSGSRTEQAAPEKPASRKLQKPAATEVKGALGTLETLEAATERRRRPETAPSEVLGAGGAAETALPDDDDNAGATYTVTQVRQKVNEVAMTGKRKEVSAALRALGANTGVADLPESQYAAAMKALEELAASKTGAL